MSRITVGVNEKGLRVGEDHQRAKLTDHDVELMRQLHEEDGIGYKRLAKMFDVSREQARAICRYQARAQTPHKWVTIPG